jgi:hypothetical protein
MEGPVEDLWVDRRSGDMANLPRERRGGEWGISVDRRAVALWPRIDRRALRRCHHDPQRIARLVAHRTSLSIEQIVGMLLAPTISQEEAETWFG